MLAENWNEPYVTYTVVDKRKFDDHNGRKKDNALLKEWLEILLKDRKVLIYFGIDEIRATLKDIKNIPSMPPNCLERDPDASNFFTVWEIENEKFVTFHYTDVKSFVVRSHGINELGSYENQLRFRSDKAKMADGVSS